MLFFVLCLIGFALIAACLLFEIYFLYAVIISKNCKYPPFVPSFGGMKKVALSKSRELLKNASCPLNVIDLGCGTGTLLKPLAQEFPNHHFIGYEWDWVIFKILKFRLRKLSNVELIRADFMKRDLAQEDLVLCFLDGKVAEDLGLKFKDELRPGAEVISSAFEIVDLTPDEVVETKGLGFSWKVYFYIMK